MNNNQVAMYSIIAKQRVTLKDVKTLYELLSERTRSIVKQLMITFEVGCDSSFDDLDHLAVCSEILNQCSIELYHIYNGSSCIMIQHRDGTIGKSDVKRFFDKVVKFNDELDNIVKIHKDRFATA